MNIIVLAIQKDFQSARKLGFNTVTKLEGHVEDYGDAVIVRYGNSYLLRDMLGNIRDYQNTVNSAKSIRDNCRNKDFTLKRISKIVNTPKIWTCNEGVPRGIHVVYRPTHHTQGEHFRVVEGGFTVQPGFYATQWIQTEKEFRVWFVNNGQNCNFLIARRFSQKPEENNKQFKCRSLWSYNFIKNGGFEVLKSKVKSISDLLGLEFGAVDVLSKDGTYYFLECNTAPSIDYPVLEEFFTKGIKGIINIKFKHLEAPKPEPQPQQNQQKFNYRHFFN